MNEQMDRTEPIEQATNKLLKKLSISPLKGPLWSLSSTVNTVYCPGTAIQ